MITELIIMLGCSFVLGIVTGILIFGFVINNLKPKG